MLALSCRRTPGHRAVLGRMKGVAMMTQATDTKVKSICVMIGDVSQDFSAELMRGIFDEADRQKVRLLYLMGMPRHAQPIQMDHQTEIIYHHNSIYDYANLFGADAYIFSCGSLSGFENENTYQGFLQHFEAYPYVILQEGIRGDMPGKSCITIDNYTSYSELMEHLITVHGHRKIALLAGIEAHPDTKERLQAYRDTMATHGYPVTDSMIAYGDFSEFSDSLALELITRNPGLEAIACCNDEMAKGCYRVCAQLGLKVGKDIAITGFDDFSTSRSLIPPLTTISQNAYQMGELAVTQAIALMEGRHVHPVKLATTLHVRRSCGCSPNTVACLFKADERNRYADMRTTAKNITRDLINAYGNCERQQGLVLVNRLMEHIEPLLTATSSQTVDKPALAEWLQHYVEEFGSSTVLMGERLNDYLMQIPNESLNQPQMRRLYDLFSFIHGFLFSYKATTTDKNIDEFRAQSWFIPEFIRDLVDGGLEDESVFLSVVKRLHHINLKTIYICLLPEPQPLRYSGAQSMPSKIRLAAYFSDTIARAFPAAQMPLIDTDDTLKSLPDLKSTTHLMSFSIFSGDVQYGILMCEADRDKCALLHVIGLQLGILINSLELKRKEKIVEDELENIRERNEILNFLYEYDPLCNILNRRGFIERAIRLNRDNAGKQALCAFLDLDHLKEINDSFGHSQGDSALIAVSDILKKTVRNQDLIARVGGDEFVGMFILDTPGFETVFRAQLRAAFDAYNRESGLPYYIEASIGIACFVCDHRLEIGKVVNDADQYLYEEKKHKRHSASRTNP